MKGENKLELKHLAPYRDSKLKFIMTSDFLDEFGHYDDWSGKEEDYLEGSIWTWAGYIDKDLMLSSYDGDLNWVFRKEHTWISFDITNKGIKPILRPLSDLTKEGFVYLHNYLTKEIDNDISLLHYRDIQILLKNHFDVFGLIEKGLAIDINTLKD